MTRTANGTGNSRIRVLIVDDFPVVRCGLATFIGDEGDLEVIGEVGTAADACVIFGNLHPDIVLVDLSLPDMDGISLITNLRKRGSKSKYIVFTTRTGADDINRSLASGAHAYLFKDSSREEVLSAIRMVAEGARYLPPAVGQRADEVSYRAQELTIRERQVLVQLARGMSNESIAAVLEISQETVKSHIKNILVKLAIDSRSEAVAVALRAGIVRVDQL